MSDVVAGVVRGNWSGRRGNGRVKVTQAEALPLNRSSPAKHARRPDDETMHWLYTCQTCTRREPGCVQAAAYGEADDMTTERIPPPSMPCIASQSRSMQEHRLSWTLYLLSRTTVLILKRRLLLFNFNYP